VRKSVRAFRRMIRPRVYRKGKRAACSFHVAILCHKAQQAEISENESEENIVKKELPMHSGPRILLWNYTYEEMLVIDAFFQTVGAPEVQTIEQNQGELTVREILLADKRSEKEYALDEKIMLFYNVDPQMIHTVMRKSGEWNLPKPIYAVVTKQSIEWPFSELAEHLVKERDFVKKKMDGQKKHQSCPHSEH